MTAILLVWYIEDEYKPAIYSGDHYHLWKLWYVLKDSKDVIRIVMKDPLGYILSPEKGLMQSMPAQQLRNIS